MTDRKNRPRKSRLGVLGVGISPVNMETTLRTISTWIRKDGKQYVCVTGVHGVMESQNDELLRSIHNHSGLTVPDGMPMVWAGKLFGFHGIERVYGPDLMLNMMAASVKHGFSHFLYGGEEGVALKLKRKLETKFPEVNIVGTYTPPFRPLTADEFKDLADQVGDARPDIFWVGLSTPKQEKFMAEALPVLQTKVMLGVGAAFDVHTGRVLDAPDWMKVFGLQWLHRLGQEPKRLWKRYLFNNPMFIVKFLKQLLRKKGKD